MTVMKAESSPSTFLLLITVLVISAVIAAFVPGQTPVYGCSGGSVGTAEKQREIMLDALENTDLVFVGTVLNERHIGTLKENEVYDSTVAAEAVLAGEVPNNPVVVRQVEFDGTFCNGGPRLREGERVLLSLDRGGAIVPGAHGERDAWRLHNLVGKVLIVEGKAISQHASIDMDVGSPSALIRAYGEVLGSSEEMVAAAVVASSRPVPPPDGRRFDSGLAVLGVIFAGVVILGFLLLRPRANPADG